MIIEDLLVESFDKLESTQIYSKELVLAGRIGKNIVISALHQTTGKGRYNRPWLGNKGNIAITIILEATENDHQVSYLTGLAVRDTITELCKTLSPKLKWVNDVLIVDKKISGILLEKVGKNLLVGIGVNLVSDKELQKIDATSLMDLGYEISHSLFLSSLLENFKKYYNSWQQHGFSPIKNAWKENAYKLGEPLKVNFPDAQSELGVVHDIDNDGNLLLSVDGKIKQVKVAELFVL